MALLFRPWAHPTEIHQDQTVSTTTNDSTNEENSADEPQDNFLPRQAKFKSIKEHIRKRSEMKSKRQRLESEKLLHLHNTAKLCSFPIEMHSSTAAARTNQTPILPAVVCPSNPLPAFPTPPIPCDPITQMYLDGWDDLNNASPELVEAALASQGMHPALLQEYARVLSEQQRQNAEKSRKQRPKKFRCPHCQVGFSNNGQLKGHVRIHTGERPFKCEAESCGKSFTRNEELTRHRRIHSGIRPFACTECLKRFGRKDHLKKHTRTHYQQRYQLIPILPSHYPYLFGL